MQFCILEWDCLTLFWYAHVHIGERLHLSVPLPRKRASNIYRVDKSYTLPDARQGSRKVRAIVKVRNKEEKKEA